MSTPDAFESRQAASAAEAAELPIRHVILAGGSGTRLWPLSREHYPKQLLRLLGDDSLLMATARRLDGMQQAWPLAEELVLVCGENHRFISAE
ncbi:sugar phosphate nucleotidyltransferase, partial [Burkholderia gladioli]